MMRDGKRVRARLKNLVIENLGLVDQGANQDAHLVLAKRARTEEGTSGIGAQVLKIVFKEPSHG